MAVHMGTSNGRFIVTYAYASKINSEFDASAIKCNKQIYLLILMCIFIVLYTHIKTQWHAWDHA